MTHACEYCGGSTYPVGRYRYCLTQGCPNENVAGIQEAEEKFWEREETKWEDQCGISVSALIEQESQDDRVYALLGF